MDRLTRKTNFSSEHMMEYLARIYTELIEIVQTKFKSNSMKIICEIKDRDLRIIDGFTVSKLIHKIFDKGQSRIRIKGGL